MTGPVPFPTIPLERCPLCGGAAFRRLPFAYAHEGATFPAGECRDCRLRGLLVQPAPEAFARLYGHAYYAEGAVRCGHVADYFAERPALLKDGAHLAERFARVNGGRRGRLLELGCATGAVLEAAQRRGWSVQGVEHSADAASEAARHGVSVSVGSIEDARLPDASFDVAFLGDVLEHVPDPAATLVAVARALAPGGALVLRGPMATHSIARRLGLTLFSAGGKTMTLREPPYHLWEFEPASLRAVVTRAGFEVEEFRQTKVPASLVKRRGAAGVLLALLDAANAAWTKATGTLGDRCELVARKPQSAGAR